MDQLYAFKQGLNLRISFAIFSGAFGSAFQHGYNTGVLNAPQDIITRWMRNCKPQNINNHDTSDTLDDSCDKPESNGTILMAIAVSIFCIGGVIGGSLVNILARRIGRKWSLYYNNFLAIFAGVILFFSRAAGSYFMFILGRLIIGINCGINAGLSPMYLSEIAPVSLRGAVGTVYQLIITASILSSQILGMKYLLGSEKHWPLLLAFTVVPALFQIMTLPQCPESPKYLLLNANKPSKALSSLQWLRNQENVRDELIALEQERQSVEKNITLTEVIRTPFLRKPLIIAMMMMLAQQLTGINAAMFYSTSIFESAGLTLDQSQFATIGMGFVNVGMTLVSLVLIEVSGRKTLMFVGLSFMTLSTIGLFGCLLLTKASVVFSYLSVLTVFGFVVGFATGPGSIPWFFVTELFDQYTRGIATSVAVVTNWSANFFVGLSFAPLEYLIGPYVFIIFIVIQTFFVIYVYKAVPETKNKPIEEITALFNQL